MKAPHSETAQNGHVVLYGVFVDQPPDRHRNCETYSIFFQRSNGDEIGGYWVVLITDDCHASVTGPFATERKAERIARQLAACRDCAFISEDGRRI